MTLHSIVSRRRVAGVCSLSLLAALTGACSSTESDLSGGNEGGASSPASDSVGDGSNSNPTDGGDSWGDESGGAYGTTSGGWPGATSGQDPSGGEPPPDDSGNQGTTGGEEGDTGESTDASTGESTSGGEELCDALTPVTLYLSPDDSNSTSSPVQVRDAVLSGWGLGFAPIRAWEFLNYYSFGYAPAQPGQVAVVPELARLEGAAEGQFALQIGVSSPQLANADRPLMNVTLVLDESGSMAGEPIELEREVCRVIAGSLRAGDVVSLVGWDTENAVKIAGHTITKANDPVLVGACDELAAGGGTDLNGGLVAGYALAQEHFDAGRINRVVLVSDGGANAGVTDIDLIADGAGGKDQDGIYLVGVGVGTPDYYNDALMDTVTDAGKGASLFVGSAAEASKMFKDRFVATMQVAARDVRVRLDLPPGFEVVKFSGEEISSDPTEVEPQHLAPNDAMVFHQTLSTCAPQLIDADAELSVTVRYRDAATFEQREVIATRKLQEQVDAASPVLLKGAAVFAYATALKDWKAGVVAHAEALAPAFVALAAAEAALPGDADLAEIRGVLEAVQAMG